MNAPGASYTRARGRARGAWFHNIKLPAAFVVSTLQLFHTKRHSHHGCSALYSRLAQQLQGMLPFAACSASGKRSVEGRLEQSNGQHAQAQPEFKLS